MTPRLLAIKGIIKKNAITHMYIQFIKINPSPAITIKVCFVQFFFVVVKNGNENLPVGIMNFFFILIKVSCFFFSCANFRNSFSCLPPTLFVQKQKKSYINSHSVFFFLFIICVCHVHERNGIFFC